MSGTGGAGEDRAGQAGEVVDRRTAASGDSNDRRVRPCLVPLALSAVVRSTSQASRAVG